DEARYRVGLVNDSPVMLLLEADAGLLKRFSPRVHNKVTTRHSGNPKQQRGTGPSKTHCPTDLSIGSGAYFTQCPPPVRRFAMLGAGLYSATSTRSETESTLGASTKGRRWVGPGR